MAPTATSRSADARSAWAVAAGLGLLLAAALVRLRALEAEAGTDPLTGLCNRRGLARAWAQAAGRAPGLLFLDLDGFKAVNDRLGHAAGDRLLAGVAARMASALDAADRIGRWGGDEFVVLSADPHAARDRLSAALGAPFHLGPAGEDGIVRIGFAAGIARPAPGTPLAAAVAAAARAMA